METPNERITCGIFDAHGGMDRWNGYKKVNATIVSGGGFFSLKGVPPYDRVAARGTLICFAL
jgi:hypothetical protein